ncbi:MAG: UDP-N-acetylglucosamine 2-epimerase (non-hydrolyzing) [bacterium]|nr:UDP-N-acetylglucosamine 2-epimerase (non-hydrolyzing) [bacterium]
MKVITIVGARPQFIKASTVSRSIERYNSRIANNGEPINEIIVHTGQHYDYNISQVFFNELNIPKPNYNLGVGSSSHGVQTGKMLEGIEKVLLKERPNVVLVYGDTNSTLAGALAAVKLHIPVGHVEAGLRSFNRRMPEEINRILVDHMSDLLFCPTKTSIMNLKKEGIEEGVYNIGDVMYDSVLHNLKLAKKKLDIFKKLDLQPKEYFLSTIHRQENTEDLERLMSIITALVEIDDQVILPLHPRTKKIIDKNRLISGDIGRLKIIDPISYLEMLILEKNAKGILTDSGGVQKEAYFFRVPCITLRDETEWIETVESGWNIIVGTEKKKILEAVIKTSTRNEIPSPNFYGDGKASEKIVEILVKTLMSRFSS